MEVLATTGAKQLNWFNSCVPNTYKTNTHKLNTHERRNTLRVTATEGEAASEPKPVVVDATATSNDYSAETIFYEGNGSNAELALSLLLGATLVYLPLTMASLGRRLWMNYKFTDRRIIVEVNSPLVKRTDVIEYVDIKEVRTAPRAFGLWGDCVVFLKNGSRLELLGLETIDEIRDYIEGKIVD
ncbi:hypothetical protein NADE_000374 [Nannochloris sp. 'desiccata']|nr:hypothetical protein KSW81_004854 [Chlorella desiccata (nom. nud.)]KAH7618176.1 hypothetical protein NADE_000374 [Chlorella desiccata (nom. nud.)]